MTDDRPSPETVERLRGYFNALLELDAARGRISDQMKDVRDQAEEAGFDSGILAKMVIRARKFPLELTFADGVLETYEFALGVNAAAAGMLSTRQRSDGTFEIEMAASASSPAAKRLTRKQEQLRDQMALAQASAIARNS